VQQAAQEGFFNAGVAALLREESRRQRNAQASSQRRLSLNPTFVERCSVSVEAVITRDCTVL
jgi:hypothetical protein